MTVYQLLRTMNQRKAYFFAGIAIVCWATVATAFKIALSTMSNIDLLFISTFSALAVLFCIVTFGKGIGRLKQVTGRQWGRAAFMGFLNPFLYYLILFKAYALLPAQIAQALNCIWPVLLVLLSIPLLGQKIPFLNIIALLVSFAGAVVVAFQGDFSGLSVKNPLGVVLAALTSVMWALYFILNMKNRLEEEVTLFLNFLFASAYVTVLICFTGFQLPVLKGWLAGVYVGFFEMGVTFVFWLKALNMARNTATISSLIYLFPFLSLLLIHYLLGEEIYASTVLGLMLIITGILLNRFLMFREKKC